MSGPSPVPAPVPAVPKPVKQAAATTKAIFRFNVFDGTRQPIASNQKMLLTIWDGLQNQLYRKYSTGPSIALALPIHGNNADDYRAVVSSPGYLQAGFAPLRAIPGIEQDVDLMILPKSSSFHFAQAGWNDIQTKRPVLARIFAAGVEGDAGLQYGDLEEKNPDRLACLLNITTAMTGIQLPRNTVFDYFQQLDIEALAADRIFGYADAQLVDQVRLAAAQGEFAVQPPADLLLHGDATSSFKQVQFGEANVQLTFHEGKTKSINGIECVYVEPDVDYYKDPGAHALFEVIPNKLAGTVSDPKVVYVLRWIAGRHAGVPEFNPLYTIEANE